MRYHALDSLRGITLVSMLIYHGVWDLVYLFGMEWPWYRSKGAYVWQQSICWTFILLSGFCWSLGRQRLKRGIIVFAAGTLLTVCTLVFMPGQRVVFGILTMTGSCMLLMIPVEKIVRKMNPQAGLITSFFLFLLCRNINDGYLGFGKAEIWKIPKLLYRNYFTSYLGFTAGDFYSTDYFSLFPWSLLFLTGYFICRVFNQRGWMHLLTRGRIRGIECMGRHSLAVYLIHQPVIYLGLTLIY